MIEYFILFLAIPLGILLAKATQDEKQIYTKTQYFPLLLKILPIFILIFIFLNKQTTLALTFIFLTTLTWYKT